MAHPRYYSPALPPGQDGTCPDAALASRLVRDGLAREHRATGSVIAEEPPAYDPGGRKD